MKAWIPICCLVFGCTLLNAQSDDQTAIRNIFHQALSEGKTYPMLKELTAIGPRLTGSSGAEKAVEWAKLTMTSLGFDSVFVQPVMVPHWVRGKTEKAFIRSSNGKIVSVNVCALGGSVGTGEKGITSKIIEVKSLDELKKLGAVRIRGKIVFYNRPMDRDLVDAFEAYENAVDQRFDGAKWAAPFGAAGVVVRSMGMNSEMYPHTGSMGYVDSIPKIPAIAIATAQADQLSAMLKSDPMLDFHFESFCEILPDVRSYNVVGELRGTEKPDEYILVGGHLDAWDLGVGANDDGSGCVQSIEVLRIFKSMGYRPLHSIRAVMFMNEENGLRGAHAYADAAAKNKERHLLAIESDRGGFVPRGFTMTMPESKKAKIKSWASLFAPYGVYNFEQEGGGADVEPLMDQQVPVMELLPDPQRYFSMHHTKEDTMDKVEERELSMGAGAMATMVYLTDQHGLD